jgi:DNA-binding GntR family transcriptional regulator
MKTATRSHYLRALVMTTPPTERIDTWNKTMDYLDAHEMALKAISSNDQDAVERAIQAMLPFLR